MKSPHILLLNKNVIELKHQLSLVLSAKSLRAFDAEIKANVIQLFKLGEGHYMFARTLPSHHWRQIVSRSYYGAYNVSRAVRLAVKGQYSREVSDHDKFGELPDDFPDKNTYANQLRLLRDDRNLCDYDHASTEADLAILRHDVLTLVDNYIVHARNYLRKRRYRV